MLEIRKILAGTVAATATDPVLVHSAYFPPNRLAPGDRVFFELEGKCVLATDPEVAQSILVTAKLDAGTADEQTIMSAATGVTVAKSPNWVRVSFGFLVGADGFLYQTYTPDDDGNDVYNTEGRQAVPNVPGAITSPLAVGISGAGVSVAALVRTVAHRLTAYVTFGQVDEDNVLTVLAARTIVRQPQSGNTSGE